MKENDIQKVELTVDEILHLICTLNPEDDTEFDIKMRLIESILNQDIVIDLDENEYSVKELNSIKLIQNSDS